MTKDKKRTATEWLSLPEAERGVALAEVLTPMGTKHKFGKIFSSWKGRLKRCQHCMKNFPANAKQKKCVPDPIVIDWNTAMEWFRKSNKATSRVKGWKALCCIGKIVLRKAGPLIWWWAIFEAQPYHYLVAAAMAQKGT